MYDFNILKNIIVSYLEQFDKENEKNFSFFLIKMNDGGKRFFIFGENRFRSNKFSAQKLHNIAKINRPVATRSSEVELEDYNE